MRVDCGGGGGSTGGPAILRGTRIGLPGAGKEVGGAGWEWIEVKVLAVVAEAVCVCV